jgi:regulator of protease activity HflC (stomatin/prohibitin superfamily)
VIKGLREKAYRLGCVPIRFSLGRIELDSNHIEAGLIQQIEEQRNRTWRAEWERRAQLLEGMTEAEVDRLRETARAEAQAQMIQAILQGLPVGADAETIRRVVMHKLVDVLERMQQTPQSQQFYPAQVITLLESLRRVFA